MGKLTEQFFDDPERYRDKTRQRIYLKDIDCPPVWHDKLKEHVPSGLFYLNDSTGEIGGPGALDEPGFRKGRGIARAGDLMSSLPPEMRAENLMCYIGHEGTYTPAHREMCASLGQNIMVHASGTINEDGVPERPGSSIWFMTETKDRHLVSEYWLSVLGHDIEVENHFAQLIAWKKAPFKTYVVEQKPGDFILIPPLAPHQVWNRGTRTMKIAWNRTTVETLELAMAEALPNSRVVCRDEQYKNKAIVYYTLLKYSNLIKSARAQVEAGGEQAQAIQTSSKVRQVQRDFKRLFDLFKNILLSEMFAPDSREHPEMLPYDSNVTCAYCRCNIFNRFLTCKACKNKFSKEIEEPYDVCMDCYCMGRSCACQSGYTWVEQWKWKDLLHKYEEWRAQIVDIDGRATEKTPLPLMEERRYLGKKTLAQVCQEQLRIRPFVDINAPPPPEENSDDEDIIVNEDGMRRVKKKKKSNKTHSCHYCFHHHPKWKMAACTNCDLWYCYGTLFRAMDIMPLKVMEDPHWKCPHCGRRCNKGACKRDPRQRPYKPKGTLLGHDTKKVADPRSVECLVDFGVSNLNFLRDEEIGADSQAMQRRRDEAERAKLHDPTQDARYLDEDLEYTSRNGITYSPVHDTNPDFNPDRAAVGYVDPSNVQYRLDATMQDDGYASQYPEPDPNESIPRLGKRNRDNDDDDFGTNKRKKKKKDDAETPAPRRNQPGKEYEKEIQKRLLDDARKEDRFIMVSARMKNKHKVVKLSLPSHMLAQLSQRESPQQLQPQAPEPARTGASILQSDVLPRDNAKQAGIEKPRLPTSFRVRIDEDESYGSRRRDNAPKKNNRKTLGYEEITIDEDAEGESDSEDFEYTGQTNGRSKGRSSAWLARRNEGEEDLPTELPPDFRDGAVNPRRERDRERERERRERRKTMPEKSKAGIRLPGRPRKSMGDAKGDGHEEEDPATLAAAALEASRKAEEEEKRKAAEREAEENVKAKMALWDAEDGIDSLLDNVLNDFAGSDKPYHDEAADRASPEDEDVDELPAKVSPITNRKTGPPQSSNSIFAQPGMQGKKIKIVGASKPITASSTGFTTVNQRVTVNMSDSDSSSDGEIPAVAPASSATPKRPVGRPPGSGRTGMVPSRGGAVGIAKRGRGRPRKSM